MPSLDCPSEGVVSTTFPRTDFPQDGWRFKAKVAGTAQDLYEAITGYGWYSATQSFRLAEHTTLYGPRSGQESFYTDFPQWGWVEKPIVAGTTKDFYDPTIFRAWYDETQVYTTPQRRSWLPSVDNPWPTVIPDLDFATTDPAVWQLAQSFLVGPAAKSDVRRIPEVVGWWNSALSGLFNPGANGSWVISDGRMPAERNGTLDVRQHLDVFNAWELQEEAIPEHGWNSPDVMMSKQAGRPVWWTFDPDKGWITSNVPPPLQIPIGGRKWRARMR